MSRTNGHVKLEEIAAKLLKKYQTGQTKEFPCID